MYDLHLHGLYLNVLRWDPAHFVRDLVSLDRDVLSIDAETQKHERNQVCVVSYCFNIKILLLVCLLTFLIIH